MAILSCVPAQENTKVF